MIASKLPALNRDGCLTDQMKFLVANDRFFQAWVGPEKITIIERNGVNPIKQINTLDASPARGV